MVPGKPGSADNSATSGNINWTAVSGATSYKIYVNGTYNATTTELGKLIDFKEDGDYAVTVTALTGTFESDPSSVSVAKMKTPTTTTPGIPGYDVYMVVLAVGISVYYIKKKKL